MWQLRRLQLSQKTRSRPHHLTFEVTGKPMTIVGRM
jgi:hypothetical protein